ncbi:telomere length regulation protein TEL2 homolog [Cucurbita moschata]|uniref:Telomere length regulation protein TEL2 homolog n=1 Tax=Cucurbita moschata TaxID=3662 RepID=A0A6J1E753_CUCMO|nr:telomere length regulation protein TEL2 homolog [Cucurbita moschata]
MAGSGNKRELEAKVLQKVAEVISTIKTAKHVDQVISALHSLAVRLFPVDASIIAECVGQSYRDQILSSSLPSKSERLECWNAFYNGAAFSALSQVLLLELASSWLACFPFLAKKHLYDIFFVDGPVIEVAQNLVPCLQPNASDGVDVRAVCSNTERLIVLCLLEKDGVLQMAKEFGESCKYENFVTIPAISKVAQIVTSIPDKAQSRASNSLSSHLFFKQITNQLLSLAEVEDLKYIDLDGAMMFVGETFSRICRRGSADLLLNELIPRIMKHVHDVLMSNAHSTVSDVFESSPNFQFWLKIMETIKDNYAVEKISEQLLHQLAAKCESDVDAYWVLWLLFHRSLRSRMSVRSILVDKFLFWKVFPIHCLRWILQFAILECPPDANCLKKGHSNSSLLMTVQRLVEVWSKKEFVQSATLEQQAYISAAVGLSLELMSKEELDETKTVMPSILQGVSCRLENPNQWIRKMASNVALVFSKVIDPKNPLYLDDSCVGDIIDWEFRSTTRKKENIDCMIGAQTTSLVQKKEATDAAKVGTGQNIRSKNKNIWEFKLADPDEIVDPASLNCGSISEDDNDDNESDISDSSSDSSLQPYDLSDDDTDLKKKLSHLVDVVGSLRKSDDVEGVERALDVSEKLIRASPDELRHVASDLVRTLIQIRCSDIAVEGEEDSTEDKRQRALVALVVMCPVESLNILNKLLYSPNVDTSQRIMILDIMTDAAQELSNTKTMKPKHRSRTLIATTAETQPWFLPSSKGPPGAGSWKEISGTGNLPNWSNSYERELPLKPSHVKRGKTRRWSLRSANMQNTEMELSHNKFPGHAAAFMLPAMQGFDKKRHGVDLLNRDFVVLGKLIYMLGVCMKCAAMHPEASVLAPPLLDMLRSSEVSHHKEAYVRRSVLFAASCILIAIHPSYVVSSLLEGNVEISEGLEWVRTWSLHVADSDPDRECYMMAMTCLQLHSEMALQTTRALESANSPFKAKNIALSSDLSKGTIKIPFSDVKY